jgi:hypothetical protein
MPTLPFFYEASGCDQGMKQSLFISKRCLYSSIHICVVAIIPQVKVQGKEGDHAGIRVINVIAHIRNTHTHQNQHEVINIAVTMVSHAGSNTTALLSTNDKGPCVYACRLCGAFKSDFIWVDDSSTRVLTLSQCFVAGQFILFLLFNMRLCFTLKVSVFHTILRLKQ